MKYLFYIIGGVLGSIVGTLISHGDLYAFKYYLLVCMIAGLFGEENYLEDVQFFKKKWLKIKPEDAVKAEIDKSVSETKDELYKNFGISMDEKEVLQQ